MTSARRQLADAIAAEAPDNWDVLASPRRLKPLTDPDKPVAIVVEQRGLETRRFSSDGERIPVGVTLYVWVVVDGSRGLDEDTLEDNLEGATEDMIRIVDQLPEHVWDGTAERTAYDEQKPAYQFTLTLAGHITQEVTP